MANVGLLLVGAIVAGLFFKVNTFNESYYKQVYPGQGEDANGTLPLYIAFLISFGGDYTSSGAIPGVQVALDQINADPSILPGYTLHYTLRDTSCHRTTALDSLFTQLREEPTKIAVIGAGCSVATEATAEVSHYYNITQISCVSSSHELSNRVKFPLYFQVLASEAIIAGGFYGIVREFGWRKVAIITQNENLFTVTMDRLKDLLVANKVNYTERRFLSELGVASLGDNPFEAGERIVIVAMYSYHARFLMCQAYRQGIKYPQYFFLLYGWYAANWWVGSPEDDRMYGCTAEERQSVLPYSLSPRTSEFISDYSQQADTGINGSVFETAYDEYLSQSEFNLSPFIYGQSCYDATWIMAKALNSSMQDLGEGSGILPLAELHDFSYSDSRLRDVIFDNLRNTDFIGITGRLTFGEDGVRRVNKINAVQYQENEVGDIDVLEIGSVVENSETGQFDFVHSSEEGNIIWRDGIVPYDGVPIEVEVHASLALAVVIYILAAAGVVFAIVCLVFNFAFRQRKLIRLSSPNLNYLIGAGAIILYIDLCFFPVPSTDPTAVSVACNLTAWLTALGYSLCYGTIVVKMCRVYYLFHDPLVKKKIIKDWMLALAVLLLCVVDLIILVVYTAVEGARGNLEAKRVINKENPMEIRGELGIIYQFYVYTCDSQARDIFLGILYGYKAALQILALVLSFGIRKVKVKGLDDSKYIAAAVYVTSIVLAVVIVGTYTLNDYVNGFPALVSIGFFIGTTFILLLVFIPRIVGLYRDPQGDNITTSVSGGDELDSSSRRRRNSVQLKVPWRDNDKTVLINKFEFEDLKKRVVELEIAQLTSEDLGFPSILKRDDTAAVKRTRTLSRVSFADEQLEEAVVVCNNSKSTSSILENTSAE